MFTTCDGTNDNDDDYTIEQRWQHSETPELQPKRHLC